MSQRPFAAENSAVSEPVSQSGKNYEIYRRAGANRLWKYKGFCCFMDLSIRFADRVHPWLYSHMKIESLHIGQRVRHPEYGSGTVKTISELVAEIQFDEGSKRSIAPEPGGLQPLEPQVAVSGLVVPLKQFVNETVEAAIAKLGLEKPDSVVDQLGIRWHNGKMVLHPSDPTLQTKEVPLEIFFHKLVGVRNQLRVLEQKVNSHAALTDGDKVEMQQYISRCYGSLTTFNLLFKNKEEQFSSKAE